MRFLLFAVVFVAGISVSGGAVKIEGGGVVQKGEVATLKVKVRKGAEAVRWYQIIPDVSKYYKNANHPWEKDPYKWVGFGKIDYERREIVAARGKWELKLFDPKDKKSTPLEPEKRASRFRRDLGSFWFQVEVDEGGKTIASPGVGDGDHRGLSPTVCRVTVQDGDDYLGHLSGFFNVPGVFGSVPYQCGNYVGVDCADVLVAARNKWKKSPNKKDYNVAMLVNLWPQIASFEIADGSPEKEIEWGKDVRRGDLIAVRYEGRKRYQHIGALFEDRDADGKLGPDDLVVHAGPHALHTVLLSKGSFDGSVVILRPK